MSRFPIFVAGVIAASMVGAAARAAEADDMIKQLLPARAADGAPDTTTVLSVAAATRDEMIQRLAPFSAVRSIDPKTRVARPLPLGPGHEAEALAVLQKLPSMQVAVAFQGSSDALSPDAGTLLGTLAQALSDDKLRNCRFVIGVHTNAIGSDDYNLSLSALRAKAIVDALVNEHGLSRTRLFAMGFGRLVDGAVGGEAPAERIQIVNLVGTPLAQPGGVATLSPGPGTRAAADLPSVPKVAASKPHPHDAAVSRRPELVRADATFHRMIRIRPYPYARWAAYHPYGPFFRYPRPDALPDELSPAWSYYDQTLPRRYADTPPPRLRQERRRVRSQPMMRPLAEAQAPLPPASPAPVVNASPGRGGTGPGAGAGPGAGGASGGSWSDRRLKRHIALIGRSARGFRIYSFQYVWGGPLFVGVMAQEVLHQCPEAVLAGPGGYLQVDYAKLNVAMMTLDEWQSIQPNFQPIDHDVGGPRQSTIEADAMARDVVRKSGPALRHRALGQGTNESHDPF